MNFFEVEKITAGYGKKNIITDASFRLQKGELMGMIGTNGSGKSTLLKAICGILPHQGSCILNNKILEEQHPRQLAKMCSYIPQRSGISIDISALDVVLMGFNPYLGLLEHPNAMMRKQAVYMLERVGLLEQAHTNYLHLSEGQKQLCIFARTLIADSSLLLLDEPESALDFRLRHRMLEMVREWVCEKQRGALVALHDPALALNYCDTLLLLANGTILGSISPRTDSIEKMEEMLGSIYGKVSLQYCKTQNGQSYLVMLKEDV